jgi:hypothetical protein
MTQDTNNLYKPLNTGEALKSVLHYIGPLTFCQPHFHEKDALTGPSIYCPIKLNISTNKYELMDDGSAVLAKPLDGKQYDNHSETSGCGIVGKNYMYYWPQATLSLNTYNSINYQDEFISTVQQTDPEFVYAARKISKFSDGNGDPIYFVGHTFNGFDSG